MSLSFQVYAVVDEDDVGNSFTDRAYYFPDTGIHSHEDGEGAIINDITVTYLGPDARIPSSSDTVPNPVPEVGMSVTFKALYSPELDKLYAGDFDGMNIPESYCPVQVEYSYSNPEPTVPEPTPDPIVPDPTPDPIVPDPIVPDPTPDPIVSEPTHEPTSNNGGGSSGGGALVAIVVVGAVILAMNNRTAIKNSFFLDEKGMGFDLNKHGKLRINSYLPNKYVSVAILSWDVGLSKSINFGLKSTLVSTGQRIVNASFGYSF